MAPYPVCIFIRDRTWETRGCHEIKEREREGMEEETAAQQERQSNASPVSSFQMSSDTRVAPESRAGFFRGRETLTESGVDRPAISFICIHVTFLSKSRACNDDGTRCLRTKEEHALSLSSCISHNLTCLSRLSDGQAARN